MRGGELARKLFRDVVVASASIPACRPCVLIHVQQGGRMYDEMHSVDGRIGPLFIAPSAAYFALLDQRSLGGAQVYGVDQWTDLRCARDDPLQAATDRGAHLLRGTKTSGKSASRRSGSIR